MMNCFLCKGRIEDKPTTFMVDLDNCIVIVKNVPSQVCCQCGETSYSNDVAHALEKIVNDMRQAVTEIAVVNYSVKVVA
ncbi:MAG: type II toxin-antitoxin system MqsA family antitoxin [Oscillospiraceae bacterium]|nr:type II toxin-antitoxin system MqsA family antitoxin [Oscillospiraceae bacterium]